MIFLLIVGTAIAALTWLLGWWGVPLAASIIGYVYFRERGRAWRAAIAAAGAWGALLAADSLLGPFGSVARILGGVLRLPAAALVVLTLVFPALVGWSAATLVAGARQ